MNKKLLTGAINAASFFLLCTLSFFSVQASEKSRFQTADDIFYTLSSMQHHTGLFTQTKILNGLSFPVISSGRFAFGKGIGLYNEINKPLFQATTYTSNGVYEWDDQGNPLDNSTNNTVEQYISQMLLAFFNGDKKYINAIFDIKTNNMKTDHWELVLTSHEKNIREYITHISITGADHINTISVYSQNGDKTDIQFTDTHEINDLSAYCQYFPHAANIQCNQ